MQRSEGREKLLARILSLRISMSPWGSGDGGGGGGGDGEQLRLVVEKIPLWESRRSSME